MFESFSSTLVKFNRIVKFCNTSFVVHTWMYEVLNQEAQAHQKTKLIKVHHNYWLLSLTAPKK